jgi:lipoprotein-anchoring transpeptidase ErfK/SrfK
MKSNFALMLMVITTPLWMSVQAHAESLQNIMQTEDESMITSSELLSTEEVGSMAIDPNDIHRAKVVAVINKSEVGSTAQRMQVYVDGVQIPDAEGNLDWLISTGREKVEKAKSGRVYKTTTPVGYFRPTRITPLHKSITWDADMPYAVFFNGGIATHGTTKIKDLGKRASGGCVRLSNANAKLFFELVKSTAKNKIPQINRQGVTVLKKDGNPVTLVGYNTLIIVENRI